MDCPICGLTNTPSALYCDCGYEFVVGSRPADPVRTEVKTHIYKRVGQGYRESLTYKDMDTHVQELLASGWQIINSANSASHVNVGRTVAKYMLTGGLGLMFGASRSAETINVDVSEELSLRDGRREPSTIYVQPGTASRRPLI